MVEAIPRIEAAGPGTEQERHRRLGLRCQAPDVSYARMLVKSDYQVDWSASALAIHRKVMGLYPGAMTFWKGKRLKLLASEPLIERLRDELSPGAQQLLGRWPTGQHQAGTVLDSNEQGLVVSSSGCPLLIREAQLEGKSRSNGRALVQQLQAIAGDTLG